ncbi:unnamed protein product [Protopolystoma xenopodis]|uniref:Uncharacterized protein n=1 Tax=Protopolystoma xenopodis TaxID=117903 RepID=A0A448X070_9PLAT|nr:unnamed protein product [Protopolystoma xenopodis]
MQTIKEICASFPCVRSASSLIHGFEGICPVGFRAKSQTELQCVNVDGCSTDFKIKSNFGEDVCMNGGICINLIPNPDQAMILGKASKNRHYSKNLYGFK